MCPVFQWCAAVFMCVYLLPHACVLMYIFSTDDEAQCIWYPQPQGGQRSSTHSLTHTVLLYFSHFESYNCNYDKHTHAYIHQCLAYMYTIYTQMVTNTFANNTIMQASHACSHMQQYSQSAQKIQNTNTHRDSNPDSPRQNILKVEQYRFVLTTFGGLVVFSGQHKFFFSLSEKFFDHKKTTFTGWLQGHPQYQ